MKDEDKPEPRFLLTVLGAVWLMTFVYSFFAARATGETAMGLSAAAEVLGTFLAWQAIAALLALACFGVARAWPKGSAARRLGSLPLAVAGLLILAFLGVIAYVALTA